MQGPAVGAVGSEKSAAKLVFSNNVGVEHGGHGSEPVRPEAAGCVRDQ